MQDRMQEVIAPKAGDELLQSCVQLPDQETETVSDELITLMQAHKNAPTRNLKTQILSLMLTSIPRKN